MRYKLYTSDGSDRPVITVGSLLPRIEAGSDKEAIGAARDWVGKYPTVTSWELTELDDQDVNIRDVHQEGR